jgi:hypothetical protein
MAFTKTTRGRKPIQPCKGVSTKRPNRCRRRTACKVVARPKGSSKTYCRSKHNKGTRKLALTGGKRRGKRGDKRGRTRSR